MQILRFLCLLLLFSIVYCCTTRTANVKIKNRSGKKIVSATLTHRYSDVFTESKEFGVIENGQDSTDYLSVRYHTGFGCNGYDWWLITWIIDDATAYSSDPNNGQCWISIVANAILDNLGGFPAMKGTIIKALASYGLKILSKVTDNGVNIEGFCNFKAFSLTSGDENLPVNIILKDSSSYEIRLESATDSVTTTYKMLDSKPGFATRSNVYLTENSIDGLTNVSTSSSEPGCSNQCLLNSKCQSYTWSSVTGSCYLRMYSSGRGMDFSGYQSGVRQSGAEYFAVQNDWDFPGNDLTNFVASSYADCAMKCNKNSACKVFTMFKDNHLCLLKSSPGSGGVPKTGLISAYEGDYMGKFIRESDIDLYGNDIVDTSNPPIVDSYGACASLCYLTGGLCKCFTWTSNSRKCYLKNAYTYNMRRQQFSTESGILGQSYLPDSGSYNLQGLYNFEYCPKGSWAYGFQQRVEPPQGSGDDTALNAIRLHCRTKDGQNTGTISSYDGLWGDWSNNVYCGGDSQFMVSAQSKIENCNSFDCTGVNSFRSRCLDAATYSTSASYLEANNGAQWGDWKEEFICPLGSAICAISSHFDAPGSDDKAVMDEYFICCPLYDCSPHATSTLENGLTLNVECTIQSNNNKYYAIIQRDGNFVIYTSDTNQALWASGTMNVGQPSRRLIMQDDGNLVIYDRIGRPTWSSQTASVGAKPHRLVLKDDGNLVIYDGNNIQTWASGSNQQ